MARPVKQGLDYLPLDVGFYEHPKIEAIADEFGCPGESIIGRLFCRIYSHGAYIKCDTLLTRPISKRTGTSVETVNAVISRAVEYGIFDQEKYEQFGVLTSKRIQEIYLFAKKRSKNIDIPNEFILVDLNQNCCENALMQQEPSLNDSYCNNNSNSEADNVAISTQSKVKKRKENINSKVVVGNGNTTRTREAENPTDSTPTTPSKELFSATSSTAKQSVFPPIVKTPQQTRKTGEEFEYWREGEYSYTPEFLALLDAIGARFNECDGRVHARQLESILREYQQAGVKDGMQVVRIALAKSETAEFIKSGKYDLRPTKFLTIDFIAKLLDGSYDKIYQNNKNQKHWKDAGLSFENMTY